MGILGEMHQQEAIHNVICKHPRIIEALVRHLEENARVETSVVTSMAAGMSKAPGERKRCLQLIYVEEEHFYSERVGLRRRLLVGCR